MHVASYKRYQQESAQPRVKDREPKSVIVVAPFKDMNENLQSVIVIAQYKTHQRDLQSVIGAVP